MMVTNRPELFKDVKAIRGVSIDKDNWRGFTTKILDGYYNESGSFLKKLVINSLIWLLGKHAIFIAPY